MGMNGIVWGQPVADIVSTIIAAILCYKAIKEMKTELLKGDLNYD